MVVSEHPVIDPGYSSNGGRRRAVLVTGRGTDIAFNLDANAPVEQLAQELTDQLMGQSFLYSRGGISVNTGSRTLTEDEESEIRRVFKEKSGLRISRFVSGDGESFTDGPLDNEERAPIAPPLPLSRADDVPVAQLSTADLARLLSGMSPQSERSRTGGMVVRATVRSGESVHHFGDLVILGDVNPGSEVSADGDIVVMGSVKGLCHAGAAGDEKAVIIALDIASPCLRIGSAEAMASAVSPRSRTGKRGKDSSAGEPAIAYVRKSSIYVSPFAGRFARYTKGVPYEG